MTIRNLFDRANANEVAEGRNAPDNEGSSYRKNTPDEFSARVPHPTEGRASEHLGPEDDELVHPQDDGQRVGADKREGESESDLW